MRTIQLQGEISREDGMFIAAIDVLHWTTHAPTLDQLLADVPKMLLDYVRQLSRRQQLLAELTRVDPSLHDLRPGDIEHFQFDVQFRSAPSSGVPELTLPHILAQLDAA